MARVKVFRLSSLQAIQLLNQRSNTPIRLEISEEEQIPLGARIVRVHGEWNPPSILIMVEHESYEDIPDGLQVPTEPLKAMVNVVYYREVLSFIDEV